MPPRRPATPRSSRIPAPPSPEPATGIRGGPGEVRFTVLGKPVSSNQTYRTRGGRWFKDAAATAWQSRVTMQAQVAMVGRPPLPGQVEVWLGVWFDSRRPDADGPVKALLDRLAPHVYANDRQVVAYHVSKGVDPLRPRVEVTVREWRPEPPPTYCAWDDAHSLGIRRP